MKHQPNISELSDLNSYDANERMHYFLTRVIESEEIWGLGNTSGWVMKEENNKTILPVWPYESLAKNCAINDWQHHVADAISLEQFVYSTLQMIIDQDIVVEIFPTTIEAGKILNAKDLADLFEGMIESGEYYMEG